MIEFTKENPNVKLPLDPIIKSSGDFEKLAEATRPGWLSAPGGPRPHPTLSRGLKAAGFAAPAAPSSTAVTCSASSNCLPPRRTG